MGVTMVQKLKKKPQIYKKNKIIYNMETFMNFNEFVNETTEFINKLLTFNFKKEKNKKLTTKKIEVSDFLINDIIIAHLTKSEDWYATGKSELRDTLGNVYKINWIQDGLRKALKDEKITVGRNRSDKFQNITVSSDLSKNEFMDLFIKQYNAKSKNKIKI